MNAQQTANILEPEVSTPRVLVLAADPAGTGGIERASKTLLAVLGDLIGPEHVGLISVWRRPGLAHLRCRVFVHGGPVRSEPPGPVSPWMRLAFTLGSLRAARLWRRRLVVVACHPNLAPVAWMSRLVSGAPYGVWCHGYETWGPLQWSVRTALRRADAVFAPSSFSARLTERAAGLRSGTVRVLPHCVPPSLAVTAGDGSKNVPPIVLTVARLDARNRYKGVDTLLRAWQRVHQRLPLAELVVAGDGSDRRRLEDLTRSLGLVGTVRFAGRVSDRELAELYGSAIGFALPARAPIGSRPMGEGFGIVLVEAAAAALPVIAGNVGPTPEVVVHGETGILVDPEDGTAVADAIVRLLEDPEASRRMGDAGRERVAKYYSYEFGVGVAGLLGSLARRRKDFRHDLRTGLCGRLPTRDDA